jgi:epsilon-lactone hydrolase
MSKADIEELGTVKVEAEGLPVSGLWVMQPDAKPDARLLLYVYGGTFALNRGPMHEVIAARLATHARARVLLLDYRLAPEHPFPLAIEDIVATYDALVAQGNDPSKIVVMGDTAGAGIALAAMLSLRDQGKTLPAGIVALCPLVDLTFSGGSYVANIRPRETTSDVELIMTLAFEYLQGADPRHPLASPGLADLSGLPPVEIHGDVNDVLYDDAILLSEKLRGVGGKVNFHQWDGLPETWQELAPLSTQSSACLAKIGQFVRRRTSNPRGMSKEESDQLINAYQEHIKSYIQPHTADRIDQVFEWARVHGPDWVWPFIQRRLKHGALVTQDQVERDWLSLLFTQAADAMVLLSASRHILLSNEQALLVLDQKSPLELKNGRLVGASDGPEEVLRQALDTLFSPSETEDGRALRLTNQQGETMLVRCKRLAPLPEDRGAPPVVLLRIISDPDKMPIDIEALQAWYDLSPREAAVAAAFAEGVSLTDYAAATDVAITTVRTHFANVKAKLGASDQAAVVRKVLVAAASNRLF